ncbi:MAG: ribonuclease HII [Bdellovibrionales bacterium]|nr:ribonuclease HII [Bdellovibrionales bacterium]
MSGRLKAVLKKRRKGFPSLLHETEEGLFGFSDAYRVAGVDEVGRGCIAGPVVVASAVLPGRLVSEIEAGTAPKWILDVRDSKLLSAEAREELEPLLKQWLQEFHVAFIPVSEIDRINILQATFLGMERSVSALSLRPNRVWIDGNQVPKGLRDVGRAVVGGDLKLLSIACASILAKVARDRFMKELSTTYPDYGFSDHKGYGTPEHLRALDSLGVTPEHRRSFAPVRDRLAPALQSSQGAFEFKTPAESPNQSEDFENFFA